MRWLIGVFSVLSACATSLPPDPVERALYVDALTLVRSQARDEWTVDRLALDAIAPGMAVSVCQAPVERRAGLMSWLDAEIARTEARLGGDARTVWRREGKDLDAIEDLLELERVRLAVREADARAGQDCPFWLEADPGFHGVQGDAERFVIFLESRGQIALNVRSSGGLRFSGGGAGRVLLGAGLSEQVTIATGFEIGGGGRFDQNGEVTGVLGGAFPVLVRLSDAGRALDLEVAAVTFLEGVDGWPPGFRAAIAYGFVTPRVGGAFSPQAMFWLGYEYHPRRDGDAPFHVIGLGTRIGVDIDP